MQLTIDVDKHFIENLKEEFHTPNIKDALNQLFEFYKQTHTENNSLDKEIESRIDAYKNASLETSAFHDGLNDIRENILNKYDS
ncbi:MAG: hypothetical protein U9O24_04920 [Campylobacterota bacterium]|nr:hypothetical protein [Campylobacterota bacterium]